MKHYAELWSQISYNAGNASLKGDFIRELAWKF